MRYPTYPIEILESTEVAILKALALIEEHAIATAEDHAANGRREASDRAWTYSRAIDAAIGVVRNGFETACNNL